MVLGTGLEASFYYSKFFGQAKTVTNALKGAWEKDLVLSLSVGEWNQICGNVKTPSHLHRLGVKDSVECWRCHALDSEGTLIHVLWECLVVKDFWKQVQKCIFKNSGDNFDFKPRLYWVTLCKWPIVVHLIGSYLAL